MKQLTLSNRLETIAAMIGDRRGVVDVGTDHGFLPVWLSMNKKPQRLVAADIRSGPLERAKKTAADFGVSDRIEFILTDGLSGINPAGCDTVVIAGMGGVTIVHVLKNAPWTKNENVLCVLQPQTKTDELLAYLRENSFSLLDAALAMDDGRAYLILAADVCDGAAFDNPEDILFRKHDPLLPDWLDRQIGKKRRALDGLARAQTHHEIDTADRTAALQALLMMKEETDKWHK